MQEKLEKGFPDFFYWWELDNCLWFLQKITSDFENRIEGILLWIEFTSIFSSYVSLEKFLFLLLDI